MASNPERPTLTPQFCFSAVALRDFLRAARTVDDSITQHLNALVTPSRAGFDPTSTAHKAPPPSSLPSSLSAPASAPAAVACRAFRDTVLFPAWQARDEVIRYCTTVAEKAQATAAADVDSRDDDIDGSSDDASPTQSSRRRPGQKPLTERDDPYLRRRRFARVEPQADLLAAHMRQEHGVETIVRSRSWQVLAARCGSAAVADGSGGSGSGGGFGDDDWEAALARWRRRA